MLIKERKLENVIFKLKRWVVGSGAIAPIVRCLLCRHKSVNLDLQSPRVSQVQQWVSVPQHWSETETRGYLGLSPKSASPNHWVLGSVRDPDSKTKVESSGETHNINLWPFHAHTDIHAPTYTYAQHDNMTLYIQHTYTSQKHAIVQFGIY